MQMCWARFLALSIVGVVLILLWRLPTFTNCGQVTGSGMSGGRVGIACVLSVGGCLRIRARRLIVVKSAGEVIVGQMKIEIPEQEKQALIDVASNRFRQAIALTRECMDILRDKYGARSEWIDPMLFYYKLSGKLLELAMLSHGATVDRPAISNDGVLEPTKIVAHAIEIYRPEFLGLKEPGGFSSRILGSRMEWEDTVKMYGGDSDK